MTNLLAPVTPNDKWLLVKVFSNNESEEEQSNLTAKCSIIE